MKAKIIIPFRDGKRLVAVGESIPVGPKTALFLFSSGYGVPDDDEAREYCKVRGYAQGAHPPAAGS